MHGCPPRELRSSAPVLRHPIRRTPTLIRSRLIEPEHPQARQTELNQCKAATGRLERRRKAAAAAGGPKAPAGPGAGRPRPARPAAGRSGGLLRRPDPPAAHVPPVSCAQGGKGWRGGADEQPRAAKSPWPCCLQTSRWGRQVASASCGLAGADRRATQRASAARLAGLRASCAHAGQPAGGWGACWGGTLDGQGGPLRGWGGVGKVDAEGL